jgi:hypothetical protein
MVGLFGAILFETGGHFAYSLDDPYIHLALSESIVRGGYGINVGEVAAPSSSILFPFLLAPFAPLAVHAFVPLALNACATLVSLGILLAAGRLLGLSTTKSERWVWAGLSLWFLLCTNAVGVMFTGLEHSLHLTLTLACALGLIATASGAGPPPWLLPVAVAAPLVRYEGLALSLIVFATVALRGQVRRSALGCCALALVMIGHSAMLAQLGLDPLPASVLQKSTVAMSAVEGDGVGILLSALNNVTGALAHQEGRWVFALALWGALACVAAVLGKRWSPPGAVAAPLLGMATAHLVAGRYGWFHRYEVYILAAGFLLALASVAEHVRVQETGRKLALAGTAFLALGFVGRTHLQLTCRRLPAASGDVYRQQVQLHRFAPEHLGTAVAVNDLGSAVGGHTSGVLLTPDPVIPGTWPT